LHQIRVTQFRILKAVDSKIVAMTEKIKVTCTRCKSRFSERVSRLRDGFQGQCTSCGCFINFSAESMDPNVRRAMTEARRIRNGFAMPTTERAGA
jgi:hypothetical protein